MSASGQFTGLPMPVFNAFGWAGEEAAISFALSQLELFITALHQSLSREAQAELPHWGLDKDMQIVYLAVNRDPETGPYIAFHVRPLAFEMRLTIKDKATLNRGLRAAEKEPVLWHRLVTELGPNWSIRIQQSHIDEESGEVSHYQDIYKDEVTKLLPETSETAISRAVFLNSELKWLTPLYLSHRLPSEQAASMSSGLAKQVAEHIDQIMPILKIFVRQQRKKKAVKASVRKTVAGATKSASKAVTETKEVVSHEESFVYVSELKPLHLRKGFINLTPEHWPFFAINARTESRQVTIYFDGRYDKSSSVWRLQPSEMARIVLGEPAHEWLEEVFESGSQIKIQATRLPDNEIQVRLYTNEE